MFLAEQRGRERDTGPAVGAVRDRDHVGVELGDLLGRRDLAACRTGVPEVHDVEPVLASGDGGPRSRRSATRSTLPRSSRRTRASAAARVRVRCSPPTALDATARRVASPRGGTRPAVGRDHRRRAASRTVPSPRTAGCSSTELAAAHDREGGAGPGPRYPKSSVRGRVGDLDRLRVTDQLEPHAHGKARGADGVAGEPAEIVGIGTRVRDLVRSRPRACRAGTARARPASVTDRPSGTGTWLRRRRRR